MQQAMSLPVYCGRADRSVARCFRDSRSKELIEHKAAMVGQRIFGIALGYEDVVNHDELRHDPIMAMLAGKLVAHRKNCAPVAGKSTLNRLELATNKPTAYHKIGHDRRRLKIYLSICFWRRTGARRGRLFSTWTPPTTRCTGIRRGASSSAITTATAICRSISSLAGICWLPSHFPSNCDGTAGS
jgi:hypothetical protein